MTTIAVAFDGGRASFAALAWAAWRAAFDDANLEVVCVLPNEPLPEFGPSGTFDDAANEALQDAADWLNSNTPALHFRGSIRVGDPATELASVSTEVDLMVVGSKRGDPQTKPRFEVVPRRVAALSSCPTIVVPSIWEQRDGSIVVGLDSEFEPNSPQLGFATSLAEVLGRRLELLHVWSIVPVASRVPVPTPVVVNPDTDDVHEERLATIAKGVRERHPSIEVVTSSLDGNPLSNIEASSSRAALIVVAARRRSRVANWVLSTVTHDLLIDLPCPIAVVPAVH